MAQYPCPQCGGKMFIEAVHEGYEVPCPHCGDRFRVPRGAAGGAAGSIPGAETASVSAEEAAPANGAEHTEVDGDGSIDVPADSAPDGSSARSLEVTARATIDDTPSLRASVAVGPQSPAGRHPPPRPAVKGVGGPYRTHQTQQDPQATLILVFGILGIVGCSFLAPVAWAMGHKARLRARVRHEEPDGQITAGWILGIIGTIILGMSLVIMFVYFIFFAVMISNV